MIVLVPRTNKYRTLKENLSTIKDITVVYLCNVCTTKYRTLRENLMSIRCVMMLLLY
jgi:hypothetical protein